MTDAEQAARFQADKDRKLANYRYMNRFVPRGQVLFTGSSLMEGFPVTEYCLNEGLPPAYNRGIGGYTTDEFLAAIDVMLLDPAPAKVFMNIGTNDIHLWPDGTDWLERLEGQLRRILTILRASLPDTQVYLMAYYPVNPVCPQARDNKALLVRTNANVDRANLRVQALAEEFGVHYIDVNDGLKDAEGNLKAERTTDGMHMDAEAYRSVFERLRPYL
ncbi:MAG: hypothetical protein IKP40_04410 [Clostridia bacterium]|nr:hypothetical protein [Clostridia bacterium]